MKFKRDDYVMLSKSAEIGTWALTSGQLEFLRSNRRLKISTLTHGGAVFTFDGLPNTYFNNDHGDFVPFKLDYNGPCPFKVGDSVRLRNEPAYVPPNSLCKQNELIHEIGLRPVVVEKLDRSSEKSLGGLITFYGNRYADWRRFEYADNVVSVTPTPQSNVAPPTTYQKKPISDHLFERGERELSRCVHEDADGICGAPYERHETLGTGLATKIFPKPQRTISRHETRLWDPYGETDLLARDSE